MADTTNALPDASVPVIDRYRRWSPVWYRWIKPLLETTRNTVVRLEAVYDEITASVTTEATARASADSALASSISTVSTTLNGVSTTVTSHTSSINGLNAQWGISIDVNDKVIGRTRLDGGATGSTFAVLADKFIITHPTSSTTEIQAFIVGLVDGVSTVGINGDLLVDGTIVARHLDVSTLSSITADIGEVTAGVIRSSDSKFVIDLDNKTIEIVP